MTPVIEAEDLTVTCDARVVVGPLSFALAVGSITGVCGQSGAGKSTLLRALVDLLPTGMQRRGVVRLLGETVREGGAGAALRARAILVPQTPVVFPGSVLDNALFGLRHVVRAPGQELRQRAEAALREAGLWAEVCNRLNTRAETLSVGQRQRLCLARALALDPAALLLDEPTSALDVASRDVVEELIAGLRGRRTVLIVSHDHAQVARLCDATVDLAPALSSAVHPASGLPPRENGPCSET